MKRCWFFIVCFIIVLDSIVFVMVPSNNADLYLSAYKDAISGGLGGQATDIEIEAKQIIKLRDILAGILAKDTGQKKEKVLQDMDRNNWMDAEMAKKYGIIDEIMDKRGK